MFCNTSYTERERERDFKKENMLHHFYNRVQRLALRLANNRDC